MGACVRACVCTCVCVCACVHACVCVHNQEVYTITVGIVEKVYSSDVHTLGMVCFFSYRDFNLDVPSALLKFLRVLLTEWEEGYQERASAVLGKLGPLPILAEQLAGLLHTMVKRIDWSDNAVFILYPSCIQITPYDYERIAFILQQLVKVEAAKQVFPEKVVLISLAHSPSVFFLHVVSLFIIARRSYVHACMAIMIFYPSSA